MKSIAVKLFGGLLLIAIIGMWSACKTNELMLEPAKNIEGTWKIARVIRNNEDLTARVDTSRFSLTFHKDSTVAGSESGNYTIVNGAPFMVNKDGTWALNDPAYPFYLILTPKSDNKSVQISFYFPNVAGQNQIRLSFSPGCTSNKYEYLLKKVSGN